MSLRERLATIRDWTLSFTSGVGDRVVLALLNVLAAWVSWGYTGTEIPFPDVFVLLHTVSAALLLMSCRRIEITPVALAVTSGAFIGRALGIWLALLLETSPFPSETLMLAGVQWTVLAWVIRPASLVTMDTVDIAAIARELDLYEQRGA